MTVGRQDAKRRHSNKTASADQPLIKFRVIPGTHDQSGLGSVPENGVHHGQRYGVPRRPPIGREANHRRRALVHPQQVACENAVDDLARLIALRGQGKKARRLSDRIRRLVGCLLPSDRSTRVHAAQPSQTQLPSSVRMGYGIRNQSPRGPTKTSAVQCRSWRTGARRVRFVDVRYRLEHDVSNNERVLTTR